MKPALLTVAVALIVAGCPAADNESDTTKAPEESMEKPLEETMADEEPSADEMKKEPSSDMETTSFDLDAELKDVTGGEEVQGVDTDGSASGRVQAGFADEEYDLLATFEGLPDPPGTDFYEGWIVKPGSVISSGQAEKVEGKYRNTYTSGQDLTDNTLYVLTIEPDDGDPAPAGHILEGTLE